MGIQVTINNTREVTMEDIRGILPWSQAIKHYDDLKSEISLLQGLLSEADNWAITELPNRIHPKWLVEARQYLGTE